MALPASRKTPGDGPPPEQIDATALLLGFRCPEATVEDPGLPSGAPGTRAPHLALTDGRSLLDPTGFTEVEDGEGGSRGGGPARCRTVRIGPEQVRPEHHRRWADVYRGHRTHIRPDGVIADRQPHRE